MSTLKKFALVDKSGKTRMTCVARTAEGARIDFIKRRGTSDFPIGYAIKDRGHATAADSHKDKVKKATPKKKAAPAKPAEPARLKAGSFARIIGGDVGTHGDIVKIIRDDGSSFFYAPYEVISTSSGSLAFKKHQYLEPITIEPGDKVKINAEGLKRYADIGCNPEDEIGTVIEYDKDGWIRVQWEDCQNNYEPVTLDLVEKAESKPDSPFAVLQRDFDNGTLEAKVEIVTQLRDLTSAMLKELRDKHHIVVVPNTTLV